VGFGPGRGFAVSEGRGLQLVSEWLLGSGSGSSQLLQRPSLPVLALIRTVHPHQGAGPQLFLPFLRLLVLDPSLRVSLCDPRRPAALPPTATSGAAPCSDRRRSPQRSLPTALDLPDCYPQQVPVADVGLPEQLPVALSHDTDLRRIL
jgi:hypothetical protein